MKYIVKLSTKVKASSLTNVSRGSAIIVIEPEDYSDKEIKSIKSKGYIILGYLSIGTISIERSWYKKYKQYKLKRLPDWPKEYYMDMTKIPWQNFLITKAKSLKARGFDGWWLDNLDVYEEYKSNSMYNACATILKRIKNIKGYVMVNGGSEFWDVSIDKNRDLTKMVNGITQEEVFSLITDYSGKGKFGKQSNNQSKFYQSLLKKLLKNKVDTFLLEYTKDNKVKNNIKLFCSKYKITGYYISENVDL